MKATTKFEKFILSHQLDSEGYSAQELIEKYRNKEMSWKDILVYMGY